MQAKGPRERLAGRTSLVHFEHREANPLHTKRSRRWVTIEVVLVLVEELQVLLGALSQLAPSSIVHARTGPNQVTNPRDGHHGGHCGRPKPPIDVLDARHSFVEGKEGFAANRGCS